MISGSQHGGRRRSLDSEVNLVPFIDLLSMCICFLLMTAVWIQIGTLQVKQSHGTDAAAPAAQSLDLEVKFVNSLSIEGSLKQKNKVFYKFTANGADSQAALEEFRSQLGGALAKAGLNTLAIEQAAKAGAAQRNEMTKTVSDRIATGMITPTTGVDYGQMVGVMDILRNHLIANLGVVPVKNPGGSK